MNKKMIFFSALWCLVAVAEISAAAFRGTRQVINTAKRVIPGTPPRAVRGLGKESLNALGERAAQAAQAAREAAMKRTAEIRGNTADEVARLARDAALKRGIGDSIERKALQQASDAQFKRVNEPIKTAAKKAEKGQKTLESWKKHAEEVVGRPARRDAALERGIADSLERRALQEVSEAAFQRTVDSVERRALQEVSEAAFQRTEQRLSEAAKEAAWNAERAKLIARGKIMDVMIALNVAGAGAATLLGLGGLAVDTVKDKIKANREKASIAAAARAAEEFQVMASGDAALAAIDVSNALETMNSSATESPQYQAAQQVIASVMGNASPDVRAQLAPQIEAVVAADAARVAQAVAAGQEATRDAQEWAEISNIDNAAKVAQEAQQGWGEWARNKASGVYQSLPGLSVPSGVSDWANSAYQSLPSVSVPSGVSDWASTVYQSLPSVGVPSALSNWWAGTGQGQVGPVVQESQQPRSGLDTLREYVSQGGSAIGGQVEDTLGGLHRAIQGVGANQAARTFGYPNAAEAESVRATLAERKAAAKAYLQ